MEEVKGEKQRGRELESEKRGETKKKEGLGVDIMSCFPLSFSLKVWALLYLFSHCLCLFFCLSLPLPLSSLSPSLSVSVSLCISCLCVSLSLCFSLCPSLSPSPHHIFTPLQIVEVNVLCGILNNSLHYAHIQDFIYITILLHQVWW